MNLSAPTMPVFVISVIIVLLALIVRYGGVAIPVIAGYAFETLFIGYIVLFAGNLLKNL